MLDELTHIAARPRAQTDLAAWPPSSEVSVACLQDALTGARRPPEAEGADATPIEEICAQATSCNREGMQQLRQGNMTESLRMLNEAQTLLERAGDGPTGRGGSEERERWRAVAALKGDTASNLGIYHRRARSHALAARHMQRALKFYKAAGSNSRTIAAGHINLATCYLEGAIPDAALRHASAAVDLAGRLVEQDVTGQTLPENVDDRGKQPDSETVRPDDYAMLAVAYHKVAEAQEGLREWGKATFAYTQAYTVARGSLGPNHHLTRAFERSSRCPHRITSSSNPKTPPGAGGRLVLDASGNTPRRLPTIPRRGPQTAMLEMPRYQLSREFFPEWPPPTSSPEEQLWYSMARKHGPRSHQRVNLLAASGPPAQEPTLDLLATY